MPQIANQAQPRARPPITSVSQWTSRNTRLAATATAIATALPGDRRASRAGTPPAEKQGSRGVERRRGRRVTARERWAEGRSRRVERRARPVDDLLDHRRCRLLAGDDQDDERHDPSSARPVQLDEPEDDAEADHDVDRSQLRNPVQRMCRKRGGIAVSPLRHAPVDPVQPSVGSHQEGEQPENRPRDDDEKESKRQRQTCRRLRIEPSPERAPNACVAASRLAHLLCGGEGRRPGKRRPPRVAPGDESHRQAGGQGNDEEYEKRHDVESAAGLLLRRIPTVLPLPSRR